MNLTGSDISLAYFENGEKIIDTKCGGTLDEIFNNSYNCEVIYQIAGGVLTKPEIR